MIDLYEAIASAALKSAGNDARRLRRAIVEFERENAHPLTEAHAAGMRYVIDKLRERLEQLPAVERERAP